MIRVDNLVKRYGQVTALQGITFEVPSGQVLGFLGPNGAGKSTTMKILTGYLYATSGHVEVDGIDVQKNPLEVRKRVGYLPETNPLYTEMRVDDYLGFVAEVRGVPAGSIRSAIDRVTQVCGLESVFKKGISELSKGFRQRVGLAQAMVHDPQIMILDEPTSGLDPNQIVEIRELVRSLGANRTVILSTHYLQEVEATCDRIMIVSRGRIVADGTKGQLVAQLPAGPLKVEVLGPADAVQAQMAAKLGGASIERVPGPADAKSVTFRITAPGGADLREAVFDLVKAGGWKLIGLDREVPTLEAVFRRLTGKGSDIIDNQTAA
jgi:ABC-2 type transport system ATP-binding protein